MPDTLPPAPLNPQPLAGASFGSTPSDPIGWLPAGGREKMKMLRQRVQDLRDLCPDFTDVRAAVEAKLEAQRVLDRLVERPASGGFGLQPHDPRVLRQQEIVDAAVDEHARIAELDRVRTAAWRPAANVLSVVESYLATGKPGNVVLKDVAAPEPPLRSGETLVQAIERHRAQCQRLRADLDAVERAPMLSADLKAIAKAEVEQLAARGAVSVAQDGTLQFPTLRVQTAVLNATPGAIAFVEAPDAAGLVAFVYKAALISAINGEIDAKADDKNALTNEARQQRASSVREELLRVERDLVALIWRGLREGVNVEFGTDVSPLAILSCETIVAPAHAAEGGVQHSWDVVQAGQGRR